MLPREALQRWMRSESGSFVLEATLTLPLVFLCSLAMLGAGLAAYQRADLSMEAYEMSERAAHVWSDSHKDPVSGTFVYEEMDGVYTEAAAVGTGWLTSLFHGFQQASVSMSAAGGSGPQLLQNKLDRMTRMGELNSKGGTLTYYNRLLEGEVKAELRQEHTGQQLLYLPVSHRSAQETSASSYITDPVGTLRMIDLIETYAGRIRSFLGKDSSDSEAGSGSLDILPKQEQKPSITSEKEAKAYLKSIIGGEPLVVETDYGIRQLDLLDSDGIVHEVKYTVNKKDAREQIKKDVEMIRSGKVKGVVWHFFPLAKTGKADLTASLRKELEQNGIIWIIHRGGGDG